jgi:hypothetical protein
MRNFNLPPPMPMSSKSQKQLHAPFKKPNQSVLVDQELN